MIQSCQVQTTNMDMTNHFCTICSSSRVFNCLALYDSIIRFNPKTMLWILCMDSASFDKLERLSLKKVTLIKMSVLQIKDAEYLQRKSDRTFNEYCWISKPILMLYILTNHDAVTRLTYLDSDIYFFSSYEPIFSEMGIHSILLSPHRISSKKYRIENDKNFGKYNAGLISIKNDKNGIKCLQWWRKKCLSKWTKNHKGGDQKYLDQWPVLFRNVHILKNYGINLGPWNVFQYTLHNRKGALFVNDERVVCYHFSRVFIYQKRKFTFFFSATNFSDEALELVYVPYLEHISRLLSTVHHDRALVYTTMPDRNSSINQSFRKKRELKKVLSNGIKTMVNQFEKLYSLIK